MKIHYDHYRNERDTFQPCLCKLKFIFIKFFYCFFKHFLILFSVHSDKVSARDLLLLCATPEEQQKWIDKIKKQIPIKKFPSTPHAHHHQHHSSNHSASSVTPQQSQLHPHHHNLELPNMRTSLSSISTSSLRSLQTNSSANSMNTTLAAPASPIVNTSSHQMQFSNYYQQSPLYQQTNNSNLNNTKNNY